MQSSITAVSRLLTQGGPRGRGGNTRGRGSPSDYYRLPKMQKELSGLVDVIAAVDHILEVQDAGCHK